MDSLKVLNLYAGIGGNRKLWGAEFEVTAVENNKEIAMIYADIFPNDKLVIADAHNFLLEHYKEFDIIWSSPPCPSHSRIRKSLATKRDKSGNEYLQNKPCFPDMKLYEEIIFLDGYFNGLYVVENVQSYYEPLIEPQKIGRHYVWANFPISPIASKDNGHFNTIAKMGESKGYDLSKYKIKHRKDQILRNAVMPKIGLHILDCALKCIC